MCWDDFSNEMWVHPSPHCSVKGFDGGSPPTPSNCSGKRDARPINNQLAGHPSSRCGLTGGGGVCVCVSVCVCVGWGWGGNGEKVMVVVGLGRKSGRLE